MPDAGRQVCRGLQPAGPEEEEARGPGLHRPHTAGPASPDSPRPANRGSPRRDGILSVRPGRLARLIRFLCWNGGSSGLYWRPQKAALLPWPCLTMLVCRAAPPV